MKRLLGTLFAATLVLSACSQDDAKEDENKKSESTTEKKTDDKKDKKTKEDKKSKEEKKSQENEDNNSTQEDNSTEEQTTQETASSEQVQSQQKTQHPATQGQKQTQQAQQSDNHEPTKEEIYEWDKQNISGGTDYGLIDPEEVNKASQSQPSQQNDNGPSRQQYEEAQAFTKDIKENPDNYGGIGGGPALTSDAGESYDQYKQRVQEQTAPQQ